MKKTNRQLNFLINYTENFYKIMYLIKMNMKVYVIFLLKMLMKRKTKFFYNHKHKNKIKFI